MSVSLHCTALPLQQLIRSPNPIWALVPCADVSPTCMFRLTSNRLSYANRNLRRTLWSLPSYTCDTRRIMSGTGTIACCASERSNILCGMPAFSGHIVSAFQKWDCHHTKTLCATLFSICRKRSVPSKKSSTPRKIFGCPKDNSTDSKLWTPSKVFFSKSN